MIQMKEHTCDALITEPNLRTSAPLTQQPEVQASYLNILGHLCGPWGRNIYFCLVFILGATMKQMYLAWRCTWLTH